MKTIPLLALLLLIFTKVLQNDEKSTGNLFLQEDVKAKEEPDSLFTLDLEEEENSVRIQSPKGSDFTLPEGGDTAVISKKGDFNADGKPDIMVYLGACGTGGCMYALFLKQYARKYHLAFNDYLKNPVFKVEKEGLWTIKSYEEIEPYHPSKLNVSVYTYNRKKKTFELHSSFVQQNK